MSLLVFTPHSASRARGARSARTVRRGLAVVVAIAATMSSAVDAAPTPAERAAAEIQAARDRADAAAQSLFDTEAEIDRLAIAVTETEEVLAGLEAEVAAMRSGLEQQAVRSYVGAGGSPIPLLVNLDETNDLLIADVLSSIATENVYVDLDDYEELTREVEATQADLDEQQDAAADALDRFADLIANAEAEVVRLGEVESQRLEDEAVRLALEEEQRRRAEQERQESEAAAAAAAVAEAAAAEASRAAAAASSASAPASGSAPAEVAAPKNAGSGLACPVNGPRGFADTWGAARSGGRRHVGVDIISPGGTPLVAMESGRIEFRSNKLGGKTLRLYGASGTRYYYAHLSAYEGSNRSVSKGDVVGYVGRTGNTTTNHLHLQIHPGGGQPVNPYPYARTACG